MDKLLTVREVAWRTELSEPAIQRYCREGKIPHYRIGRLYRFDLNEVLDALKEVEKDD